ncbi:MAG: hypothetical protein ACRDRH_24295, partial [Pseudonocardia sp.]
MRPARRIAVLAGCVIVALTVAWYAGSRLAPTGPLLAVGSIRLGPEAGEPVAQYLARLPVELPAAGVETLALVQFAAELTPADALAAVGAQRSGFPVPVTAVLRVPLPRVQTALRFEVLEPGVFPTTALGTARERARRAAHGRAARLTGRQAAVAAAKRQRSPTRRAAACSPSWS